MNLPGMDRLPVPITAQIACVERELRFRGRVYPKQVAKGVITQGFADEQLDAMQAVLETLRTVQRGGDDGK